jgi:hypothetical protein
MNVFGFPSMQACLITDREFEMLRVLARATTS